MTKLGVVTILRVGIKEGPEFYKDLPVPQGQQGRRQRRRNALHIGGRGPDMEAGEVSGCLKQHLANLGDETLVITRACEPATLLVADPRFQRILERSRAQFRAGQGLSEEQFWQQVEATPAAEP